MKKALFILFCFWVLNCKSQSALYLHELKTPVLMDKKEQTGIYTTYEDYVKGNLEKMSDEVKCSYPGFSIKYTFKTLDGKWIKKSGTDFWGFIYKGKLFRSEGKFAYMLVDTGKIWSYLNAEASITMINRNEKIATFSIGPAGCISVSGVNAKLYFMSKGPTNPGMFNEFKADFPKFEDLFNCIEQNKYYFDVTNQCVINYNKSNQK
jgi:hypothetical protein